ncbi:mechanosensitive ion channel family protein [Spongiivirga citrea]|uniref:Mechanosensing system component YbdG n=1 Tax=Spongiivirga citrea TaxID=1481457 RepID=A0A6M0CHV4_9FLAO|nr:mechanosensitive ion channel domain-containing protein [Spongiivirga citrea]NER16533.1 mechanosensitive ion channel [Spongiivirga citrea]
MEKKLSHIVYDYLISIGLAETAATYLNMVTLFLAMLLVVFLCDYIIWKLLRVLSSRIAKRSKTNFDDLLVANKLPRFLAHVFPLLLAIEIVPWVFIDFQYAENVAIKTTYIIGVVLILRIVRSLLNTIKDHLKTLPTFKDKPIDSYIQVFMIFAWVAGIMTVFAIITETTIWKFFTALGAASAIILLIFKDTILGFVASIQVSINDMVRIGDWITFEKYGADGDVVEINLATVKVQNFDKTITTIPTYALISDSFKNWRGMNESDGRRIKRALIIKQESVSFLTDEKIEQLKKIELLTSYLESRGARILEYNEEHNIDKSLAINGKNLTNLGVFRKYVETYVENHSAINKDMTIMVRQLPPSTQGIPIEIYAFSSDKRWKNYEYIIADIFDHLIASIKYFELELFEQPSKTYVKGL